jgi:prepilin-type N-terminal cleavage/methylation domain-containing protein
MKNSAKKGFTLAEVLVTLIVIGIVAALTIPALIQTTNQAELKTALKKSLATLNQAIVMSVAQNSVDAGTCTNCETGTNNTALANFFINKLNILSQNTTAVEPFFYTADGMKFTVVTKTAQCGNASSTVDPGTAKCVILVDVNGDKSPNSESTGNATYVFRDQYRLVVKQSSVLPASNDTTDVASIALQQ